MMGFHTRQIREKCVKCKPHHIQKLVPGSDFHVDFCTLADMECSDIKHCDVQGKVWIKKEAVES
jgi:hypothetical protein